jgi:hypothetical protein
MRNFFIAALGCVCVHANAALPTMPTTGTCAFLITQPVPLGVANFPFNKTGYNVLGTVTFTGEATATVSGNFVNVTYRTTDSPLIVGPALITNMPVTVQKMTPGTDGFAGGYILSGTGTVVFPGNPTTAAPGKIVINAVPSNGGKTILLQLSTGGSNASAQNAGPGSGTCQF